MQLMTKRERVMAATRGEEVDKVSFSLWYYLPHLGQDPIAPAEKQIHLTKPYDLDFIKMMPFGNYVVQDYGLSVDSFCTRTQPAFERKFEIESPDEWLQIEPLSAMYGAYGKQLQLSLQMKKRLKEDIPCIQTIFSPLTVAKKLAGSRVSEDMYSCPDYLHKALAAITETTINLVKASIDAGVSGFFFVTQCATRDYLTLEEHSGFGEVYDRRVVEAYTDITPSNILHIHGPNAYFKQLAEYSVNCINWRDRWVEPDMETARTMSDKCFLGGINEKWLEHVEYDEVGEHLRQAVGTAGRRSLMLTPGCCIELDTSEKNLLAVSVATHGLWI